jgi:DNA mismatch endonuclease (patch repair protein)
VDTVSVKRRSEIMARVRSKDTAPEMFVRRLVFRMGYRYRLHAPDLSGRPDLVFRSRAKVVFVHGCFWHRHQNCVSTRDPKSRQKFWREKLDGNRLRDARNQRALVRAGWKVMTVWECQLKQRERLKKKIRRFLDA